MKKLSKRKEEIIKKYGKIPSKKELFEKIQKSQERLIVSLVLAWESAPEDPLIRADILEAIQSAVNLREKVYQNVLKKEPPEIKKSYDKLKKILEDEVKKAN